jgi:hypothetical protein
MKSLINLKWHTNTWSKDKEITKEKYIELSKEEAEKDIPMLLKMSGGKSIHDPTVRKHLDESIDWQIKNQKEMKEHNYKILRSEQKDFRTQQVLDIGAGMQPDARATHAIDLQEPGKNWFDIKYQSGVDMEKENLPYRNNQFHRVISYASLGMNFGNDKTYKEVYRILKSNGVIEIGLPYTSDERNVGYVQNDLKKNGFRNIKIQKKTLPNGGIFTIITANK